MSFASTHQKDAERIKLTLKFVIFAVVLLLVPEFAFSPFDHVEIAFLITFVLLVLLYFWVNEDTIQVIGGLLLWGASTLIFYLTWVNYGIFDIAPFAYPCIILLAIITGTKLLYIPLIFCIILQVLLVYVSQHFDVIKPIEIANSNIHVRTINIVIIIILFCAITLLFVRTFERQFKKLKKEKEHYEKALNTSQQLLMFDPLTKLPNEHICHQDANPLFRVVKDKHMMLSCLVLDVINLRQINHSLGHNIGDALLIEISTRLSALLQEHEYLYRISGNEFMLTKLADDTKEIDIFKDRLLQAMLNEFSVDDYEISALCSIGITISPFDGHDIETLRAKAHLALQHATSVKENNAQYYKPEIKEQIDNKYLFISTLKQAIENGEFQLYYQPKINLQNNKIIGVEALIRWQHPDKGWIPPNVFIPMAEEAGLITEITKFVIHTACQDCVAWQERGYKEISVAVNLSAVDFKRGGLPQLIFSALKQSGLSPHLLELEITESTIFDDIKEIQTQIRQLQQKGITFAIDDFGTGYSNLGYLNKFNVSVLKIDQSFVKKVAKAVHEQHIVNAILTMSKSLEITNVAEGIEDAETAKWLAEANCQIGQGYYWHKPMPFDSLLAVLATDN